MIAFVLGSASCLAADIDAAMRVVIPDFVVAVNAAGRDFNGPLDHFATMHPELATGWLLARDKASLPPPRALWCPISARRDQRLPWRHAPSWGGSSGLFGAAVAMEAGADRIILCGVPLDSSGHFDDPRPWKDALRYRAAWTCRRAMLVAKVRSMSGWTQALLGAPTREWLCRGTRGVAVE